jgi:hypothetical protein
MIIEGFIGRGAREHELFCDKGINDNQALVLSFEMNAKCLKSI